MDCLNLKNIITLNIGVLADYSC